MWLCTPPLLLLPSFLHLCLCEVVLIRVALHVHKPDKDADSALGPFLWFCFMFDMWAPVGSALEESKHFLVLCLGLGSLLCLMQWQYVGSLQSEHALCSRRGRPLKAPDRPAVLKPSSLVAV